jgi:hypothetical protein
MATSRLAGVLTLVNLALLLVLLGAQLRPATAQGELPVLRGRGLEIVDGQGRVRASIQLLPPASPEATETVLLRLITERGRPSVKIGASEQSSGLSFAGPTGTRNSWLVLESTGIGSSLRLRDENGAERVLKP